MANVTILSNHEAQLCGTYLLELQAQSRQAPRTTGGRTMAAFRPQTGGGERAEQSRGQGGAGGRGVGIREGIGKQHHILVNAPEEHILLPVLNHCTAHYNSHEISHGVSGIQLKMIEASAANDRCAHVMGMSIPAA